MEQAPNQLETEQFLDDVINPGTRRKLANALGVSVSEISQQFNPYDPSRKSYYYQFKRQLNALCEIDPEAARLIKADLDSSFDSWLGETKSADIGRLTARALKETAELGAAHCEGKPVHLIKKEALDARTAVDEVVAACDRQTGQLREVKR